MATLIKTDGKVVENYDASSLEKMQQAVGGYIEIVAIDQQMCLIVNEDGLSMGLSQNLWASMMTDQLIVGDVIYINSNEIN